MYELIWYRIRDIYQCMPSVFKQMHWQIVQIQIRRHQTRRQRAKKLSLLLKNSKLDSVSIRLKDTWREIIVLIGAKKGSVTILYEPDIFILRKATSCVIS